MPAPAAACLVALLLALLGCAPAPPAASFTPSFSDGERATYDVTAGDGAVVSTTTLAIATKDGRPTLVEDKSDGKHAETPLTSEGGVVANDASLTVQRGLPFATGYRGRYTVSLKKGALKVPLDVVVEADERVTVPAGAFDTWRVSLSAGPRTQLAWYQKDAPHLLVRYENPASHTALALRSYRLGASDALHGVAEAPTIAPPPLLGPVLILSALVQWPLMIGVPIALFVFVRRRTGIGFKVAGLGALAFVGSQVVHLPLNWALGLLDGSRGVGLWPLPLLALAAGVSAGVCEEVARWLMLRYALRRSRSWADAVQFGVGHGGGESVLLGVLAALSVVTMALFQLVDPAVLGVTGDAALQVRAASATLLHGAWYLPILGGIERLGAIAAHIAMSVLVMRAVVRGRLAWLGAAIAAHALLDGAAVLAVRWLGPLGTEAVVLALGAAFVALTFALRDEARTDAL